MLTSSPSYAQALAAEQLPRCGTQIHANVKLLLEEFRAAAGVAQILRGVSARFRFERRRSALESRAQTGYALAVRMIESFGDAQNRGQPARGALIAIVQRGICSVIAGRIRFAVVIAHSGGDDGALASFESGNVSVHREIFAVLVMAFVTDGVADVMEQSSSFEEHARFRRKMVHGLQLIEKLQAKFADVFGVALIVFEAARETARSEQKLARGFGIAMRLFAREAVSRDFVQQTFANADGGNR